MSRADWYPAARREPLPDDHGGPLVRSLGLVLHVVVGDGDPWGWFDRPDVQASSHWWIGKDGGISQFVAAGTQSWAQVGGNSSYHSVETAGYPDQALTDAQVRALAALYRWGHAEWGWPYAIADQPGAPGFGIHSMGGAAWGGHACPGPIRASQRPAILALAQSTHPAPPEDDVTEQDKNDIANKVLDALRKQVFSVSPPIRQGSPGAVIGAIYNKVGADQGADAEELANDRSLAARLGALESWLAGVADAVAPVAADAGITLPTPPWATTPSA